MRVWGIWLSRVLWIDLHKFDQNVLPPSPHSAQPCVPWEEDTEAYLRLLFLMLFDRPEFHTWNLNRSQRTPTISVITGITITSTRKCGNDGWPLLSAYCVCWLEEVLGRFTNQRWSGLTWLVCNVSTVARGDQAGVCASARPLLPLTFGPSLPVREPSANAATWPSPCLVWERRN